MQHRYALRFGRALEPAERRAVEVQFAAALAESALSTFGGRVVGAWRWDAAEARLTLESQLDDAAHGLVDELLVSLPEPVVALDRGDGWAPLEEVPEGPEGEEGIEMVEAKGVRPRPPEVPPAILERFVFDDYVLAAPDGRYLAFVRDERRCHFVEVQLTDEAAIRRAALPPLHDVPRHAWSPDGRSLLVGGPLDVLHLALDDAPRVTALLHDEDAAGFDVCWLSADRFAAVSFHRLSIADLAAPARAHTITCRGGRLVRAVLDGRVLIVGTADGAVALGIDGACVHLLARDWRTLDEVWQDGARILAAPAQGGVCELRGLEDAWTAAVVAGRESAPLDAL